MAKCIFVFNDGTGNELESTSLSNVAKIFNALPGSKASEILKADVYKVDVATGYHSLYYRGIGTPDCRVKNDGNLTWFQKIEADALTKAELFAEAASGLPLADRVEATLADLERIYNPGDKVYFFGFSRGAASIRIVAALMKKINPDFEIEYMLVFDTVYSVQGSIKIRSFPPWTAFTDQQIGNHVKRCDHLVSGDELREFFPLTPVTTRPGVRQIVFAGSHSDVGGGADHSFLSDFPLDFSIKELTGIGIGLNQEAITKCAIQPDCSANIGWDKLNGIGMFHFPRDFSKMDFQVHNSVFLRMGRKKSVPIALGQLTAFTAVAASELVNLDQISAEFKYRYIEPNLTLPPKATEVSQ